jgi:hypothetical protein
MSQPSLHMQRGRGGDRLARCGCGEAPLMFERSLARVEPSVGKLRVRDDGSHYKVALSSTAANMIAHRWGAPRVRQTRRATSRPLPACAPREAGGAIRDVV